MEYTALQKTFISFPYRKQVYVYAEAMKREWYALLQELAPCILGTKFLIDVQLQLNK